MPKPSFSVAQMDADWGSSSDEETTAERAARDAAKLQETMALLAQFEKTREPEKQNYGAMDAGKKFRQERAAAAGRAIWEVSAAAPSPVACAAEGARPCPARAAAPPPAPDPGVHPRARAPYPAHENGLHPFALGQRRQTGTELHIWVI